MPTQCNAEQLEFSCVGPRRVVAAFEGEAIERLWTRLFLDAHRQASKELVLDLDATDDPLHRAGASSCEYDPAATTEDRRCAQRECAAREARDEPVLYEPARVHRRLPCFERRGALSRPPRTSTLHTDKSFRSRAQRHGCTSPEILSIRLHASPGVFSRHFTSYLSASNGV
jgi:hypothetical protein